MKRSLLAELKRRNVFRAVLLYIGAVWALAQGIAQLGPVFGMPEWGTRWFVIACAVGFPFWVAFAWYFAFTPDGLKRERDVAVGESFRLRIGRDFDFAIIGFLSVAVVLLLTDRFVLHQGMSEEGPATDTSIAVLPFVDMSPARDQEYFSDGIAEELLNLLSKNPQLKVAARTSSFSFKGRQIEVPEIGRQLHVSNVLEGSVRKSGDRVRITAQLIHAADGFHLWSGTYERELDDIFKVQDEIAADVVRELKVTLLGAVSTTLATDPEAYARYLQARQLGRQFTAAAFAESDSLYRQVLEIDPNYSPAWVGLSRNLLNETSMGVLTYKEGFAGAREAVAKALAIDPDYAPAHAALGWIAMYGDNDIAVAAREFARALELDPTDLEIRGNASALLVSLGRLNDALAIREAVVDRDPVNVTSLYNLGITQLWVGRLDDAIATFRMVLSLGPGRGGAHYHLGVALLLQGDAATALTEIEQETSEFLRMYGLPLAYHALGRKVDSDAALAELIEKDAADSACNIAAVYAFRGESDKAFEWLGKAVENQDTALAEIGSEILFANIRADSRWLPLLRMLGKSPQQLAKIEFKVTLPPS